MNDDEIDLILNSIGDVKDIEINQDEIDKILKENDLGSSSFNFSPSFSRHIKAEDVFPQFLRDSFETPQKNSDSPKASIQYDQELINQILADLEEEKKPKIPITKNPLDAVDENARKILDLDSYESKFAITCPSNSSKQSNIVYEELDIISRKLYPKSRNSDGSLGIPRCMAIRPPNHIAVGTSYALIAVFSSDQKNFRTLGGAKEQNYGPVSCLEIADSDESLISGYENGYVALWDLKYNSQTKLITNLHNCPLTVFSFYNGVWSDFISGDSEGNMFIVKISKVFLSYTVDRQCLLKGNGIGISSISKMPSGICKGHYLTTYSKIVSICSFNQILIVLLEPTVRVIMKIEKPENVREGVLPCVSFGIGDLIERVSDNPLMAVSWGEKTDVYEFLDGDYLDKPITPLVVCQFETNHEIMSAEFIAPSLIFLTNSRKEFKILFTGSFVTPKGNSQYSLSDDTNSAIVNSQLIDPELLYQTHLRDSVKRVRSCYGNTIKTNFNSHSVFVLSFNGLYKGIVWEWSKYLNELSERGEWVNSLQLSYEMYSGKNRLFYGLPSSEVERKNKMRDFLKSFCSKYLNQLCSSLTSISLWNSYITVLIDFCLGVDCYEFLFIDILKILKIQGVGQTFMENLEPFVMANRIKAIPDKLFKELVVFYKSQEKLNVIQRLIINLDVKLIDPGNVIPLCLEYNMFIPLIFICTKLDGDFITPLVKLFSRMKEVESEGEESEEMVKEYGYKILWYIRLTLSGHYFPEGLIEEGIWPQVIKQLAVWIFAKENLLFVIKIDPDYSYDILLLFFAGAAASNVEPDPDFLSFFDLDSNSGTSSGNLLREAMLQRIISVQNNLPDKFGKQKFIIFLANIVTLNTFNLDKKLCISNIRYILNEESHFPKMEMIAINLVNACSSNITNEELEDIIEACIMTPFKEMLAKLYFMKKENVKGLKSLLDNPDNDTKMKIFNYLNESLVTDDKQSFELIWNFILEYIKELVSLNSEATQELIQRHNRSIEKKAVVALSQWPSLQLEFLEKILDERKNGASIENELLILHVSLLCRLNPAKLTRELRNHDYPLDDSLKLCRENGIQDATAYLLEHSGAIPEALEINLNLFGEQFKKIMKGISKGKPIDYQPLHCCANDCIQLCMKNSVRGDTDSENLWFLLLNGFLKFQEQYFGKREFGKEYSQVKQITSEIINRLFENIVNNVSLKTLIKQLENQRGDLVLRDLKISFLSILSNYSYEENILNNAKKLIMNDLMETSINIFVNNNRGFGAEKYCGICKKTFLEIGDKLYSFQCGHSFHEHCLNSKNCPNCNVEELYQLSQLIINAYQKRGLSLDDRTMNTYIGTTDDIDADNENIISARANRTELKLRKLKLYEYQRENRNNMVFLMVNLRMKD